VFDGIDIDWEYPVACGLACGRPEDRENFTGLLAEFRRQLDAIRPGLELTVAVGAGVDKVRVTDPGQYHQYLDAILVMTYDFNGTWDARTNHHSALFRPAGEPNTGDQASYNTDDSLNAFLQRGVPASKLNIGIGFYGRGWTGVPNVNNGLYQNGRAAAGTYEAGNEDYKVLKNLNWPSFRDNQAGAHWIFNGTTFWSFDDPQMVRDKMSYARQMGLGGAFFWELSGDDAEGTLARAVHEGLRN
jgi:chitinase